MFLTIISFVFIFGMIVFAHELGHFTTAKLNGIKIHEFALGMGPVILKKQGKETLYSLRALPIGGYVKMEGEDEDSDDPRSFSNKKPLPRLIILAAGAIMNFILAYVLLVIIMFGMGAPSNYVGDVIADYPAIEAGIQVNDEIIAIDDQPIKSWDDVIASIDGSDGKSIEVTVKRGNDTLNLSLTPKPKEGSGYQIGIQTKFVKKVDQAFVMAGRQFGTFFTDIFKFFTQLGRGNVQGDIVGPVGLVSIVGQVSKTGIMNLLLLAAYISINLGIVNLLPFPALDGGRIIFVIIEMIKGKPIDREKEGYVHFIGFAILMALMVFLVIRDVQRL
ncbi:RIP metalloprotease RseP [Fusibacter bizertensis]|uniref:Zinc metalloprotease n=1 Tax=Fusibacter bizertensis TaxID=1488331 RepID=A0ABT6N861_9FIRM|nr:RIP metalloprotease RseP [Fusibacter bizertensis]MDH8676592.1 RIP metalloprotease RseP [Fusibacter bizertensis]